MIKRQLLWLVAVAIFATAQPSRAADPGKISSLSVAAAANLIYALDALDAEFNKTISDVVVTSTTGASGNLVAQITHGAPYDVFLSADRTFPQALIKTGQADGKSLTTFALGRLVLWTTKDAVDVSGIAAAVRNRAVQKLAIANVTAAPFGRAAEQALKNLGAWDDVQSKLVVGENISQTAQFVETGNADAGFVALSIVISPKLKNKGRWTEVSANLYDPLEQCAVVTVHGASNPSSARFIAFLHGNSAQAILKEFGYGIPLNNP